MREREWLRCRQSGLMLHFLEDRVNERKLFLFGIFCLRQPEIRGFEKDELLALKMAEKFVEGLVSETDLKQAFNRTTAYLDGLPADDDAWGDSGPFTIADGLWFAQHSSEVYLEWKAEHARRRSGSKA